MSMSLGLGLGLTHRRGTSLAALIRALFRNDEAGAWLDPSDSTTLFQNAAGTTPAGIGDPVRLALDKSQGLVLGPELVANGEFDTDVSGWTLSSASSTFVWDEGRAVFTRGSGGATAFQVISVVAGKFYEISIDLVNGDRARAAVSVAGAFPPNLIPDNASIGTYKIIYQADSDEIVVHLSAAANGVPITYDNISVRELPGTHALAPSDAARPLVVEVDGNIAIRRDLIDDQLDVTLPEITNGKIIIGTTDGVWVDDLTFAGGTFSLGPTTYTGGPVDVYDAIGADELGTIILDRQPTEAELDNIMKWFKSKGAPGKFVLGDEIVSGGDFTQYADTAALKAVWTEADDTTITMEAGPVARVQNVGTSSGYMHKDIFLPAGTTAIFDVNITAKGDGFARASIRNSPTSTTASGSDFSENSAGRYRKFFSFDDNRTVINIGNRNDTDSFSEWQYVSIRPLTVEAF